MATIRQTRPATRTHLRDLHEHRNALVFKEKQPTANQCDGLFLIQVGTTGFEPRVAVYLLPYPASVGSTERTNFGSTGLGVVGPISPNQSDVSGSLWLIGVVFVFVGELFARENLVLLHSSQR
jgi:hypothetical protein